MNLERYQHKEFTYKPNKYQMEPIEWEFSKYEDFNEIYLYCREHFMEVKPTKSKSMPYNSSVKMYDRYMVVVSKNKIELTVVCHLGCYRFLIGNKRDEEKNPISGKESVREIYKEAKKKKLDLSKYKLDSEEGEKIKSEIMPPHITKYGAKGLIYENVHHLDLNSSYASRICEVYPEFKSLYDSMYQQRHNNDDYFKHVLTNHIGCWQSEYCPDVSDSGKIAPYQFANLSKIAVNGTRKLIELYINKLEENGRTVLLTNTDGIWYQGDIYHDELEGKELGQWKNDHINCTFLMKSKGAYQYVEDGKCHSVVRGLTQLDREKPRDEWELGDIFNKKAVEEIYTFDKEQGVVKDVQEI